MILLGKKDQDQATSIHEIPTCFSIPYSLAWRTCSRSWPFFVSIPDPDMIRDLSFMRSFQDPGSFIHDMATRFSIPTIEDLLLDPDPDSSFPSLILVRDPFFMRWSWSRILHSWDGHLFEYPLHEWLAGECGGGWPDSCTTCSFVHYRRRWLPLIWEPYICNFADNIYSSARGKELYSGVSCVCDRCEIKTWR